MKRFSFINAIVKFYENLHPDDGLVQQISFLPVDNVETHAHDGSPGQFVNGPSLAIWEDKVVCMMVVLVPYQNVHPGIASSIIYLCLLPWLLVSHGSIAGLEGHLQNIFVSLVLTSDLF